MIQLIHKKNAISHIWGLLNKSDLYWLRVDEVTLMSRECVYTSKPTISIHIVIPVQMGICFIQAALELSESA